MNSNYVHSCIIIIIAIIKLYNWKYNKDDENIIWKFKKV